MSEQLGEYSPLARAQRVSRALREAARVARRSTRSKRNYDVSTFSRQRGAALFNLFIVATFWLVFAIPVTLSTVYFALIASPQYVTEARFTVHGGEGARLDGLGSLTGLPSVSSVQDTQIVTNYLTSQAIVRELDKRLNLRARYSLASVDWFSRFDRSEPLERLVDYWKRRTDVSVELPAGIVQVRTRAFTASDSLEILNAALGLAESLVNDINLKMLHDNVSASERELERAARRLVEARLNLERARNSEGILDAGQAGKAISELITGLRSDQLRLQQERDSMRKYATADAPQLRAIEDRISAIAEQIRHLEANLTGGADKADGKRQLSQSMTRFSELETEYRIAERQYGSAAAVLTLAKTVAERRMVYFQQFVRPALPQESTYPKRTLSIVVSIVCAFLAWAVLCGLVSLARNNMA